MGGKDVKNVRLIRKLIVVFLWAAIAVNSVAYAASAQSEFCVNYADYDSQTGMVTVRGKW